MMQAPQDLAGPRWPPLTPQVPADPRRPYSPSMPAFASLLWRPLLARASQASSLAHSLRPLHLVGLSVFLRQPLCSAQPSLSLPIQQPSLPCVCPSSATAIAQQTLFIFPLFAGPNSFLLHGKANGDEARILLPDK